MNFISWHSSKYERYRSSAKLGVTYFARDLLRSYFDELQKMKMYVLNESYVKE